RVRRGGRRAVRGRRRRAGVGGGGGRRARVRERDRFERVLDQLEVVTGLDRRQALLALDAGSGVVRVDLERLTVPLEDLLRGVLLRGEVLLVLLGGAEPR